MKIQGDDYVNQRFARILVVCDCVIYRFNRIPNKVCKYDDYVNQNLNTLFLIYNPFTLPWLITGDRNEVYNINKKFIKFDAKIFEKDVFFNINYPDDYNNAIKLEKKIYKTN